MGDTLKRLLRNEAALVGGGLLTIILLIAVFGPMLLPVDPFRVVGEPLQPPFGSFLLGTDVLGRDVAAGIAHGARASLGIALAASVTAVLVGTAVGAVAGYYGGILGELLMRITEFFQTIPTFLFAIVIVAILPPTTTTVAAAIAVVSWPGVARLVRAEFMSLRDRDFVYAAQCLGASDRQILVNHILPNCFAPIIVTGSLMVANAILVESALSFLGLGDTGVVTWGYMIGAGRSFLRSAWWLCAIPGIAILLTVLAINLVGEGLNDALNPRLVD